MILCIGSVADSTFWSGVSSCRQAGIACDVLDLGLLAMAGSVIQDFDDPLASMITLEGAGRRLGDFHGMLVRLIDLSKAAPSPDLKQQAIILQEALLRALRLMSDAPINMVNLPPLDNSNFAKLFHAVSWGRDKPWRIPRSCLTNDPDVARNFLNSCPSGAIFKGASATKTWVTRVDQERHLQRLPLIRRSPTLFQECIDGPDIRVHVIGDEIFAEMILSDSIDYRNADSPSSNRYCQIDLPAGIAQACIDMTREMGIALSGIDFKIRRECGTWYFLEANSMPCYEGYDRRLGGKINAAIRAYLIK